MTEEGFKKGLEALFVLSGVSKDAAEMWVQFAKERVERGQYVDFTSAGNSEADVENWLASILDGICAVYAEYGYLEAKAVYKLSLQQCCLYPGEMFQAAECLRDGGTAEQIMEKINSGEIDHDNLFSPYPEQEQTSAKHPELPEKCYSMLPETGMVILITKGKKGYEKCGFSLESLELNRREVDRFNTAHGVTRQQEAAMLGGATKGWSTPAARAFSYDEHGEPVKPAAKTRSRKPKETAL